MATRIRTLNFLPEIFKTQTNSQFLQASLDQIVDQPNIAKIQGYIGSKFGYGINAKNYYVTEPSKVRTDYQLDPGVVFTKPNETTPTDFITYPGINDAVSVNGGLTQNNNRLYESEFYSWDSFTQLDSLINFNQYYWLPSGPPVVTVGADTVFQTSEYAVTDLPNGYQIAPVGGTSATNPTLTLLRGGTYTFQVNQDTQFWIQGEPGVTGYSATQPNLQTRDVYGVENNGASSGVITFNVPFKDAQDRYNFPGNNEVDIVCNIPFNQVQGALVSQLGGIDGVTALAGLTVMFYDTGISNEYGYLSQFFDTTTYDQNGGVTYDATLDFPGTDIFDNNYEGGFYTQVAAHYYTIVYVGDPSNPTIKLVEDGLVPINQKITAKFGKEYGNRNFYKDAGGVINLIPYISAPLDTIYYQDGSVPGKFGVIKLIESNYTNSINVETDILGKLQYTAGNNVKFTNGLKIEFENNVQPESYRGNQYYVQGVGTGIELVPVSDMLVPELASGAIYIPYDTTPYDVGNYDSGLYIPVTQDYITIARNSKDRNAWSRSNRWFHIDVITATAEYNNDPSIVTTYATKENKAKRPIIEFYPNLRLFNSGTYSKAPVDFIDTKSVDAFTEVAGQKQYYPDTASYTSYTATINGVTSPTTGVQIGYTSGFNNVIVLASGTTNGFNANDPIVFTDNIGGLVAGQTYYIYNVVSSSTFQVSTAINGTEQALTYDTSSTTATWYPRSTTIVVDTTDLYGNIQVGQFVQDLYTDPTIDQVLPNTSYVVDVTTTPTTTTIKIAWYSDVTFATQTNASIVTANTTLDNYQLFPGSRIVFTADSDLKVRNKIYTVEYTAITPGSTPVITLTVAKDGEVLPDDMTVAFRGYNFAGYSFFFDGLNWHEAQTKKTVNQAPRFDIFDYNGVSLGNKEVYYGSSFKGTTLFSYSIGTGTVDSVLGFPVKYSSINNVGDISFDVTLNSDTFNYVNGSTPITENVNVGYVYKYTGRDVYTRELGWQTAVSPSVQYQVFEFNYTVSNTAKTFECDIPLVSADSTKWPLVQVYVNNVYQTTDNYTYTTTDNSTLVTLNVDLTDNTPIQVLVLSDKTSANAYYQIPINLNNNPLNQDLTTLNVGDIRGQYQSIFYNNPNTTGDVFGSNNYRDLGNLVPWGNKIIQNSASLVLPGAFLRKQNHNLFNALQYNSNQYITFKSLLISTINSIDYSSNYTPADLLDDAIAQITANKAQSGPFFYSDMLPSKAAYITNTYSFANSLDVSIYPLSRVYDFTTANYYGVLVYLTRTTNGVKTITQLVRDRDYVVSADAPSLTVTIELLPNDVITVKEYNQTYGSYVPNTPTKLGLYPASIPSVFLDTDYQVPTYFIIGHDGSFTKLYGNYDPTTGQLDDIRDQVLLEYETRVYNNLKLSNIIPIQEYEVVPGFFRDTGYSYDEFLEIYSESFLNWVGQNRIRYKEQSYNRNNEFTYNYRDNSIKLDNSPLQIGYWRGIYQFFYDTSTPNITPWEMIGYRNMPSWWTNRYGAAPYTSENLVLWTDMQNGVDWNNGDPVVIEQYKRPGLLDIIPVDTAGNLVSPFVSVLGNYNGLSFQKDWIVGDVGPAEFAFRRSSSWPFALMRIMALAKPAEFFNLAVDIDHYKYSEEFGQYLINNRSHLKMSDIAVYGSGDPVTSYINWIVDYEKQIGVDATTQIKTMLLNMDVRLVYRLAGFSDKDQLRFYVEKGTPNSRNASLLIPDESYSVLLYDNQPETQLVYSGVVVQTSEDGYRVYGNSQTQAYFKVSVPKPSVKVTNIAIETLSVNLFDEYYDEVAVVPYGTTFYTPQEVAQFLANYGNYLQKQGVVFADIQSSLEVNWNQMIAEFLYWAQMGWGVGSIINLNPAATKLEINKENNIVQPLVFKQQNFVLNQNLMPIALNNLNVVRDGTSFVVEPLNQGDTISYSQFNLSSIEHGIVFDNVTLFNDVIYNLVTGLRQVRLYARGSKSAEWNGTLDAQGFILNQDNVTEWDPATKYTKGSIVKYKNKYWSAITIVQPKETFEEKEWQVTDYNQIQKGLLPNSSTNSYEATLYYDVNHANLKNDSDLLSFSLIGYRPRDYLAIADLTDITQVNVYQNLIKNKGTLNAASAFKGAILPQGGIDYDIYENWAIQTGEFGGVLNSNFVDVKLNEAMLPNNPSTVALTNGYNDINADMEIPLYAIYNYQRPITDSNILGTIPSETPSKVFPDAGYVNYNDVKMASYYYANLATATNQYGVNIPLDQLYARDYVWLANFLQKWQVLTPVSLGSVVAARNNLNGTVTITFSEAQTLTQYQPFAIVNFNSAIDGYYVVAAIVDPYRVIVNMTLDPNVTNVTGLGVAFQFQSQRVNTPADIINLPLLNSEFSKNKVWVDTNDTGSWAVYRKSLNYNYSFELTKNSSSQFGSCVAQGPKLGYLIGDSGLGNVYRYTYDENTQGYQLKQTLTQNPTFGSYMTYSDDIFVISETSGNVYVYQFVSNVTTDQINLLQTISSPVSTTSWGQSTSISGDKNWIFISDPNNNLVYVYRLSQVTGQYEQVATLAASGILSGDQFGTSVTTDYYADTVIVGAPKKDDSGIDNVGFAYVFNRLTQNFEAAFNSLPYTPQTFALVSTPAIVTRTATNTSEVGYADYIKVSTNLTGVDIGDPVVFSGTLLSAGAIQSNKVYYVVAKSGTRFKISATRGGSPITLATATGSMTCSFQTDPVFVNVNGTLLTDDQYAVIGTTLNVYPSLSAGDIVTLRTNTFVETQTLDSGTVYSIGEQFGQSVDATQYASEVIVGAPFAIDLAHDANQEGAVFRFTNGGNKYGMIVGTTATNVTTARTILLNGYAVNLTAGNAAHVANQINEANVTNVVATDSNGLLVISLIDNSLSIPNKKLTLQVTNKATLTELGVSVFTNTQTIVCPHGELHSQFGYSLKFNEYESFVVSARTGNRYSATTFDFIDDESDNDTVFDNNTTVWVDTFANAGAVYMFDYLPNYSETISNTGNFVYAQSVNSDELVYGAQPYYGTVLDFSATGVIVGTPNFNVGSAKGLVTVYQNPTGEKDWSIFRESGPVVDINKIQNAQIYSASTNDTLVNLDYIDPLQGKILGVARQNIDFISNNDPASYNNDLNKQGGEFWGSDKVGQLWFNTSGVRFVNYHQQDFNYNNKWWGKVFPGSDVAVYSFITSNIVPALYQGPGTPLDVDSYSIEYVPNQSGTLTPVYFYWVRNTNIIFEKTGKTLSDTIVESYITNPQNTGVSYFTPVRQNAFSLYNCAEYINYTDSVLHIGYSTGVSENPQHTQYSLIRSNYADDFLPGLPSESATNEPASLYEKFLDSLSGLDRAGSVVPDPMLPLPVRSGVMVRPRQSFFYDRYKALENLVTYANSVLLKYPFNEITESKFLYKIGPINPSTGEPFYHVSDYIENVNWWADGYDNSTKASIQVAIYADLVTLDVPVGTIVSVAKNGAGFQETYISNVDGTWTRIGLQYGTLQLSSSLYDYASVNLGFGDNFFDTTPYDIFPSEETRYIVRALCEELPPELLIYRNELLMLLFAYIESETIESQNFLPWLNKTSFIDVSHTIRELKPVEVYQSDNQEFLEGYLNEVKPYHVVIKEFLFKYTGNDTFGGDITDFDVPATYNENVQQYISPQLVYSDASDASQYLYTDPIWQTDTYKQWFDNYGVSITGQYNYYITNLASYLASNTNAIAVDNASGFPVTGVMMIGEEKIAYSSIDHSLNIISGLTRGYDGTTVSNHIPGERIHIDLPAVLVLYGGRGYTEPPKVTAYIDTGIYPAPRQEAILTANMSLDVVQSVTVANPGTGYAALPRIVIDPAFKVTFDSSSVTMLYNTVQLEANLLKTGDIVTYTSLGTPIGGLESGQHYYVNVLETTPIVSIAFYTTYKDCVLDQDRVKFYSAGSGTQEVSVGAIATCISSAKPIRENTISIKFDRTTYKSQVIDWAPGDFYGSFYAGAFNYSTAGASSGVKLQSTRPDINTFLASADGATFEILDVENVETIKWSSRLRNVVQTFNGSNPVTPNTIKISPTDGGATVEGTVGSTIGFYVGMPIKFTGEAFGNIQVNKTYYVESLVNISGQATGFRIATSYDNAINGIPVTLTTATAPAAGLTASPGAVTNQALMTIDYPGIRKVTATSASDNSITIPITSTGFGGTRGFYTGLMLFFVGQTFGGIVQNEIYYVTSVIDDEHFTMSTEQNPIQTTVYGTLDNTDLTFPNYVICDNNVQFNINDPIIFSDFTINGVSVSSFGGLNAGQLYYIANINGNSHFTVANQPNGAEIPLTAVATSSSTGGTCINQKNVVQLSNATGSINAEINLPVSPGQITGQQFTLSNTSKYYTGLTSVDSSLLSVGVKHTIGTPYSVGINRVVLDAQLSDIYQIYNNMPVRVSQNIGGLTAGTTYYVIDSGATTVQITNTSSSGNLITCDNAGLLYVGMPIKFTGSALGGLIIGVTYFVKTIASSTTFTVSSTLGGTTTTLYNESGAMSGTGEAYIKVSATLGGLSVSLSDATPASTTSLMQYITSTADFGVRYLLGGYSSYVIDAGTGYTVDNIITITGDQLGGTSPANDLTMTVNSVDANGGITSVIRSGIPAGAENKYYLKVVDENRVAVYANQSMTVPVSGLDFPYTGIVSTSVTSMTSPNITVASLSGFEINDPVIFTGTVAGNIVAGKTYYIKTLTPNLTVSETLEGSTFVTGSGTGLNFSMSKVGDFAVLPEPFYFNQSVVKYNHRVYRCMVSNNDPEFIFGKWELLDSGNNLLNAMDRAVGYYEPTVNMPGLDLTQLFTGVTYPNSTYRGNAFAPDEEFALDTILNDQPFYPTQINMVDVVWNGVTYIAPANTSTTSVNVVRENGSSWALTNLSNQPIGVTSIFYNAGTGVYVVTTTNAATPILISTNGYDWISEGAFTPYDVPAYGETSFDVSSTLVPSNALYATAYHNGVYVSVGENIVLSTDTYQWQEVYSQTQRTLTLKDVKYFNLPNFVGFIAVGKAINNTTLVENEYIVTSANGYVWTNALPSPIANNSLNSVTSNGTMLLAVGENGIIYGSNNGSNWINYTTAGVPNLNKVTYANGMYVAVGDNGRIQTSTDGESWTVRNSGVTEKLNSISYNTTEHSWLVVGDNNIILSSTDAIAWAQTSLFQQAPTVYNVQGDEFTAGYGPEELVSGVVSDNLTMIVNTRPGTNWDATVYQHVGYAVTSKEFTPIVPSQTVYSFAGMQQAPAQLKVFIINGTTNLSTTLYPTSYTVDWIAKTVTLASPVATGNRVRIDVYTVGNGDQLVKGSTDNNPVRINTQTGFSELYVNCNYSAPIYSGSGVIRPGTQPIESFAYETRSSDNTILVQNAREFVVNSPITFSGTVFGGVQEDTVYYVKTISYSTNRITISDQFNTLAGIAGPTLPLSDATGLMDVIIQIANGTTWTDPAIYYNGGKLLPGHVLTVTKTKASTDTVVCNTTNSLVVGEQVVFSDSMFAGSGLEAGRIYYIKSIYDGNEFSVSLTPGGATLALNDATGGASCIIGDYGFGIQPNGISAKIILSGKADPLNPGYVIPYDDAVDYVQYTLFGETTPVQYGYTIPETQYITGDGSTLTFAMTNYNDGSNPTNAVVEHLGVRLTYGTDYTIDGPGNSITFTSARTGLISITTYNLTDRQYLNTQYGINGVTVSTITSINNNITPAIAETTATSSSSVTNEVTVGGTTNFIVGQTVYFKGTGFGNIVPGTVYYVKAITSGSTFIMSTLPDLSTTFNPGTATGVMSVTVGGQRAVRVTTTTAHNLTTNDIIRIDGTLGSVQLNNNTYYARVINSTQIDLYSSPYSTSISAVNTPITEISSYIGNGYLWIDGSYIISDTSVTATDSLTGQVTVGNTSMFVVDTPIVFTQKGTPLGTEILGGIIAGQTYYVKEISSITKLKISATRGGDVFALTTATASGNTVNLAQWEQSDVDRLWVTINGYRVPSSSLRINPGNYISILAPVTTSDKVIITSMMPSATPNEEVYMQNVNKYGAASVYRVVTENTTWLSHPLQSTDSVIYVQDASKLVNIIVQNAVAPAAVNGVISVGINADKNIVSKIVVYNNTTGQTVGSASYTKEIVDLALTLQFTSGVSQGDSLTITVTEGNLIYINGEQIKFGSIDLVNNTLTDLQRGVNGTGATTYDDVYSTVYGILSKNRLPEAFYTQTWNSYVLNTTLGDPLQISNTFSSNFLNEGES